MLIFRLIIRYFLLITSKCSGPKNDSYKSSNIFLSSCFTLQTATYKLLSVTSCEILCLVYILLIFGFEYLSIFGLMKNEEKHMNILERKIILTERENVYFIYYKIERLLEVTSECSMESSRILNRTINRK